MTGYNKSFIYFICLVSSMGGLPERPLANVLIDGLEADCGELIRLQDVSGFTLRNAAVRAKDNRIVLDGCRDVRFDNADVCEWQMVENK